MLYIVVPIDEITENMVDKSALTSPSAMQISLDRTKGILRYSSDADFPLEVIKGGYQVYSEAGILEIIHTPEWTPEIPM